MIEILRSSYKLNKLHNSWLISTNNSAETLAELQRFIIDTLFDNKILLQNNPDFKLIEKASNTPVKNISVEQIRELQEFLNHTSVIFPHKVAIIYRADFLSHNAANCTLKILEEAPGTSYIFLVTTKAASILPTIRSRCAKIHHLSNVQHDINTYSQLLNILTSKLPEQRLELLKQVSEKNREQLVIIADNALQLMVRIIKKSIGVNLELNNVELEIMSRLRKTTPTYLLQKCDYINNLIDNTINYDLDLRASCMLLIEQFNE